MRIFLAIVENSGPSHLHRQVLQTIVNRCDDLFRRTSWKLFKDRKAKCSLLKHHQGIGFLATHSGIAFPVTGNLRMDADR